MKSPQEFGCARKEMWLHKYAPRKNKNKKSSPSFFYACLVTEEIPHSGSSTCISTYKGILTSPSLVDRPKNRFESTSKTFYHRWKDSLILGRRPKPLFPSIGPCISIIIKFGSRKILPPLLVCGRPPCYTANGQIPPSLEMQVGLGPFYH